MRMLTIPSRQKLLFSQCNSREKKGNLKFSFVLNLGFLCLLILPFNIFAQDGQRVSGKVTNASGEQISGVTIKVKNKETTTVSDETGNYNIIVPSLNETLVFSSVGFSTSEVPINGRSVINLQLEVLSQALEDVVVVGYGTQKKATVTGSISSVDGSKLSQAPNSNLSNSLVGRVTGVTGVNPNGSPGSGSTISIRGIGTMNNNSPLIVVDGIVRGGFYQFDPNEIASLTVLKDASAAIYGARAANGVILVTTKQGSTGKPVITYSADFGVQQPTYYPKLMNGYQYATIKNQALLNMGFDPSNPTQSGKFYTEQQIADLKSGKTGVNWYDATFKKNPIITHHNLNLNGGSDAVKYFVSLGYVNQDGMYENSNFKRYNFRSNLSAKVSKNLSVNLGLDGRQENYGKSGFEESLIFSQTARAVPTHPLIYWPDGKPYNTQGEHPVEMVKSSGYQRTTNNSFQGTVSANWLLPFITPGLSLSGNASWGKDYNFSKNFNVPYTMYDEDGQGNVTGSKVVGPSGSKTTLTESYNQNYSSLYNISLNYDRTFGNHNVKGLVLYEQSESEGDYFSGQKADFLSNIKDEMFASGTANQTLTGNGNLWDARQSVVGRVNYDYKRKYLLEGSFRYDGSFIFPKDTRFGFFPSISAGWNISEEPFIKNNPSFTFIDNLKIRVSKGLLGNDRVNAFQYEDSYSIVSGIGPIFSTGPASLINYGVYPNPSITWEKTDISNIGLDGILWNGLLGFEMDYFNKQTRDILWAQVLSVPATFGRSLPKVNYAEMQVKGFELKLTHRNNVGKFRYDVGTQLSYAVNKVTRIDDPVGTPDYNKQLGKPLGFRVGYQSLGIFQTDAEAQSWMGGKEFGVVAKAGDIKYADMNKDGQINSSDQVVISKYNGTPRIIFGMDFSAEWKNFNLTFLIQGGAQNNILLAGVGRVIQETNNIFTYLNDSWSPNNKDAQFPLAWVQSRPINDQNSSVWLKESSYARLKSLQIGYSLNQQWLKPVGIKQLRVYVSGFNLFTVSQQNLFDPESTHTNYTGSGAYYPQQRILNVGVNLTL
jgi:TonB-linked SusC/RagA family outer membrane protein